MGLAPLKENLAAGLMAITGWDGSVPLVDPFCGSATLLIEAVSRVLSRAPGLLPGAALSRRTTPRPAASVACNGLMLIWVCGARKW